MEIIIKIKVEDFINNNLNNVINNQLPPEIIDALHNANLNYQSFQIEVKNKISAIKNFAQVSNSEKKLKRSAGNSESKGIPDIASSLDNASKDQKRYFK